MMKLISCDSCGIVLDEDKLEFPEFTYDGTPIDKVWNGDDWVTKTDCPVCKYSICKSS